ncbi:MAG: GntR family transcriptional regulator [Egibacteraceae bacterium]
MHADRGRAADGDPQWELADGQPLLSETDLIERYGVSRNSVRNAVALLRVEGLVVTEHGRGTHVRARRPLRRRPSRYSQAKRAARRSPLAAETAEQGTRSDQLLDTQRAGPYPSKPSSHRRSHTVTGFVMYERCAQATAAPQ